MPNKFIERKGTYDNIEDFIREFTGDYNDKYDISYGMDFEYNGRFYYLTRTQIEGDDDRIEYSKILGIDLSTYQFEVAIYDEPQDGNPFCLDDITITNFYKDIYDLLDNYEIEGIKFKDLLLGHKLRITCKDG